MCLSFVTILLAGNINKVHLDGVGLANTLFNIMVLSLSQGYSYVFDTFGPLRFFKTGGADYLSDKESAAGYNIASDSSGTFFEYGLSYRHVTKLWCLSHTR